MIASQLSGHCDVIRNRLWHHQENENRASEIWRRCVKIVVFIVIYKVVMSCKKIIVYVVSWRTVSALTRVLFWCLFPSLLGSAYIILYISCFIYDDLSKSKQGLSCLFFMYVGLSKGNICHLYCMLCMAIFLPSLLLLTVNNRQRFQWVQF